MRESAEENPLFIWVQYGNCNSPHSQQGGRTLKHVPRRFLWRTRLKPCAEINQSADLQREDHHGEADHHGDADGHDDGVRVVEAGDHARHVRHAQGQHRLKRKEVLLSIFFLFFFINKSDNLE